MKRKTAALLECACVLGLLAGGVSLADPRTAAVRQYARALGLAFQIQDDILDATSTTEDLGKPVGSDAANEKSTYVTLLGLASCRNLVAEKTQEAKAALAQFGDAADFLCRLADALAERRN